MYSVDAIALHHCHIGYTINSHTKLFVLLVLLGVYCVVLNHAIPHRSYGHLRADIQASCVFMI